MPRAPRGRRLAAASLALAGVVAAGCAGRNMLVHTHNYAGRIGGFWAGLWHGLIVPVSLIGSIFLDVNIYEVHNKGFLYNLGFVLGISTWVRAAALRIAAGQAHDRQAASPPKPSRKADA